MERDRGVQKRLRPKLLDESAAGQDDSVLRLDALLPDGGKEVGLRPERVRDSRGGPMDEVRELAWVVAGKEQAGPPHQEDLGGADTRRVERVIHDDRGGALERDPAVLIAELRGREAIRVAERLSQRDLDPRRQVVVVLVAHELGDLACDLRARPAGRDHLTEEVEAPFRAERRTHLGLAHEDRV